MNDKIKWFGRYLGCKCSVQGERDPLKLIGVDSDNVADWACFKSKALLPQVVDDCVLILKELKNIGNEDFAEINKLRNNIHGTDDVVFEDKHELLHSWHFLPEEVDFLRSKGYAIGIPKEYYITEDELK